MSNFVFQNLPSAPFVGEFEFFKGTRKEGHEQFYVSDPEILSHDSVAPLTLHRFGKGKWRVGYLRYPYILREMPVPYSTLLKGEK